MPGLGLPHPVPMSRLSILAERIRRLAPAARLAARVGRGLLALVLALVVLVPSREAAAVEIEVSARYVKREVLALYDSRHEPVPHETRIHKFAEMPMNWLGLVVVYHDVNTPLPEPSALNRFRGVLTWFAEPLADAERIGRFLDAAATSGLRYVVLGEVLPGEPAPPQAIVDRLHRHISLTTTGEYADITFRARVGARNAAMIGFERPIDKVIPDFPVTLAAERAQVHLSIETRTRDGDRNAAVVVTGPGGGYAAQNFTIYYEPSTDRVLWTLNPFQFFKTAFGEQRFPVPDTTTLSGRRIYFSHIDGDGWNNVSEVEGYREAQVLASDVIAREAIEPFPDLPVSVALISGDVMPLLGGNPAAARIARRLFALPQVEVASHTHTHPFNWQFFERYDRTAEQKKVDEFQRPVQPLMERVHATLAGLAGRQRPASAAFDKYVAGSDDLPRTYLKTPFDLELEISGSLKIAESLAPPGKKARLYQWSGDTTPFEQAIGATRRAGVRNINGGDSRLDREYPSVSYVPPIGRVAGKERQIYAGNSNENTYTNDWTGPYYGFLMLDQTLANTDRPRRLKPFNLYYHMYSGEKPAALSAIRHFLALARSSPVVPVAASDYAAIADDFYTVRIEQEDLFAWSIASRGELQTVRFDDADALAVDAVASVGVIGSRRHNGALYVALDPKVERAIVALVPRADARAAFGAEGSPIAGLEEARWRLSAIAAQPCAMSMTAQGFGSSQMVWQTRPSQAFRITARRDAELAVMHASADAAGRLLVDLKLDAREPLSLRLECHG